MSIGSSSYRGHLDGFGTVSSDSRTDQSGCTIGQSRSDFSFVSDLDEISVSTIVEKLVTERLKLGIVKSAKGAEQLIQTLPFAETENVEEESLEESISSLQICLDKFEAKTAKINKIILDVEPDDIPPAVIEPNFSEPEDDIDIDYRDPNNDTQMMLNRTRSFYTPTGFKDSRFDLKMLESEREKMWTVTGPNKYTIFLYEEAMKHLTHIRIKGRIYDEDEDDDLPSREDAVVKSLESIMAFVKPIELPPEKWDPGFLATLKNAPHWALAPPHATDNTINTIRYIHKTLREIDFHKQDPKLRRRTGRRVHRAAEESEESEESSVSTPEDEESEDEPYMLKRRVSVYLKKKVAEVVEEEDEEIPMEIKPGRHNLQVGHEISISTLQKTYPDSPESTDKECEIEEVINPAPINQEKETRDSAMSLLSREPISKLDMRSSWVNEYDIDVPTSEESLYEIDRTSKRSSKSFETECKPYISMHRGFPVIRQRPKWITLKRECFEKEEDNQSLVERYRCLCLHRGLPPLETVARNMLKKSVICNRMGRGPENTIQTMFDVLGTQITVLDLSGVYMSKNDFCYVGKALPTFTQLTKLKLPRTKLTDEHFSHFIKCLKDSIQLCLLDVSYNSLRKITVPMVKGLQPLINLTSLNLRHCELSSDSLYALSKLPASLLSLDISWNRLNDPAGLRIFSDGLTRRQSILRELRIAWNSISGNESARILSEMGRTFRNLTYFDISYNGFSTPEEMYYFRRMLTECRMLKVFFLAGNPLVAGTSETLLNGLELSSRTSLRLIDLGDIWVTKEIYQICKGFKETNNLEIRVGGIKGNINLHEIDMRIPILKRLHFLNYSKKKKRTLKHFGKDMKELMKRMGAKRVKHDPFLEFMDGAKFKVDEGQIKHLTKVFSDKRKMIDIQMAHDLYSSLYPDKVEKDKKKPRRKRRKKEVPVEEPIVELMEPKLKTPKSYPNILYVEAEKEKQLAI